MVKDMAINLAAELFGSLGWGSWDEYDPDLDWKRFEMEKDAVLEPPGGQPLGYQATPGEPSLSCDESGRGK